MYNEVSEDLNKYFEDSDIQFQLVPPHMHRRSAAERAVITFNNHFISSLCTMDSVFPFYFWDRLLTQVTTTLNMLRRSRLNRWLSAYEKVDSIHNFERAPLAPLGYKMQIHENLISESPMLPTQLTDGTLDHQYIIIDVTSAITLILEVNPHQIQ